MNPLMFLLFACKEDIVPNDIYEVAITNGTPLDPDKECSEPTENLSQTHEYALFFNGTYVEIEVDGEFFATGEIRGCTMTYESGMYLGEGSNGDFRWQIFGRAEVGGAAGGCSDIPDQYDWFGIETLSVVSSENDDIDVGCTYTMETVGNVLP